MYHPGDTLRLWRNRPGDGFRTSTHAGLDECLPTVGACTVDGHDLPDHGSCWAVPWRQEATEADALRLVADCTALPLRLERTARLDGAALHLAYRLANHGTGTLPWGWAFHGLLAWRPGDRIRLPEAVRRVAVAGSRLAKPMDGAVWSWPEPRDDLHLDQAELGGGDACAKVFAGPLATGWAAVEGDDGQRLSLTWDTAAAPWIGLWITRGGYLGQHGIALEPSTMPCDRLSDAGPALRRLEPGTVVDWRLTMEMGSRS